mgnify:CR=1 FL=1
MRTRKYKTLEGLFKGLDLRRLTFNDYRKKYVWVPSLSTHVKFELSEKLDEQVRMLMASGICSTKAAIRKYAELMRYSKYGAGILDRLWIEKSYSRNEFCATYCAGQDYVGEVRYIQSYLR